nr:MAG TPA: YebO-like protein [Crassvirales sp.]
MIMKKIIEILQAIYEELKLQTKILKGEEDV